jgi:hypothetical protein
VVEIYLMVRSVRRGPDGFGYWQDPLSPVGPPAAEGPHA